MIVVRVARSLSVPLVLALVLLLLAGLAPTPVRAASHAVTVTMNDANSPGGNSDVTHLGGGCAATGTGTCSLRDAVIFANSQVAADTTTITLPAGTYTLRIPGTGEDIGFQGDLNLDRNVTIVGAGAATTIVQASATGSATGGIDRVFEVGSGGTTGTATISGVTIRYGNATAGSIGGGIGGGIAVTKGGFTLTLNDCVVTNNAASGGGGGLNVVSGATLVLNRTTVSANNAPGGGGGAFTTGTLTVMNSTFSGNTADFFGAAFGGGGIYNNNGTLTVINSTFAANHADGGGGGGGGIYNNNGTLTMANSTLSGNTADGMNGVGGGILGGGTLTNSTLSGNTADGTNGTGGGIFIIASTLTAVNTLIAGNTAIGSGGTDSDVKGAFAAASKNTLLGDGSGATGIANGSNGNIVGTTPHPINPLLDSTLRDNGTTNGTQTLALLSVLSPANNTGDDATCLNAAGIAPVAGKDQRGVIRPQPAGGRCDIGAYELIAPTAVALTAGPSPSIVGQAVTFTATVTGSGGTPTGSVTVKDGAAVIGGGTLFSGVASFTTAGLAAGNHTITALYSGDTIFTSSASLPLTQIVTANPPPPSGLQFYPLPKPVRLLDTRVGATAFVMPNTPLTAGQTLPLPGQFSANGVTIPPAAQAIVGNATVANGSNGTPAGFATIFPTGVPQPLTSNLNFVPGTVRPNNFTVALGGDGKFNLFSSSGGDFVIDLTGYYAPVGAGGLYFHPLAAPVRELDTRVGASADLTPGRTLAVGETLPLPGSFTFAGITVPASAKALVGNATVANNANGTPAGFATLYPDDVPLPLASNLNFVPGTVAPNAFTVALGGGDGGYNLYTSSGGDFIIDLTGYLDTTAAGGLLFTPLAAPVRELDTRVGATADVTPGRTLAAGETLPLPGAFTFAGITIPASAKALVGNATVANDGNATPAGFATLYPDGVTLPLASNLNFVAKQVAPNAIVVGVGGDGKYNLYTSSGGDFVIDITGYFS